MVDADMTYSAKDIHNLMSPVKSKTADMVVGDRLSGGDYRRENKRSFHGFGNALVRTMINLLFRSRLKDIMSGYRVFSREFVKNYPVLCEGFEIETEMTLHALDKRFRIVEIPVEYNDRPEGSVSKLNTVNDGIRVIKTIFTIFKDYKPLLFFGSFSLLFFIFGLIDGIPVIIEYFETKFITKVPSAILAMGLVLVSLLSFSIGLILDTVVKIHKFNYELQLNKSDKNSGL